MSAVEDVHGLLQEPHFPNAVQWSADNLIAVASGASAVILNPCNLAGPRALLPTDGAGLERPPHSDLEPPEGHVLGQLLRLRGEGARGRPPAVRAQRARGRLPADRAVRHRPRAPRRSQRIGT